MHLLPRWLSRAALVALFLGAAGTRLLAVNRVTLLYDSSPAAEHLHLESDWGYAALIEFEGRRILLDTGADAAVFARNTARLGVDLTKLDFVVITHKHSDHTGGMDHLLKLNPRVKIYAPLELPVPPSGPPDDGDDERPFREAWPAANFTLLDRNTELAPGVSVVALDSPWPYLRELSLTLATPKGQVVFVGCSHPGIERILAEAEKQGGPVHEVLGGFHLLRKTPTEVERIVKTIHEDRKVAVIAAGHCTGETAFAELRRVFGPGFIEATPGTVLSLP